MQRSRQRIERILRCQGDGCIAYDALRSDDVQQIVEKLDMAADWREYFGTGEFRYVSIEPSEGDRETFAPYVPGLPEEAHLSCWGVGRVGLKSVEGHHAGHRYWHPLARVETVAELERFPFPDLSSSHSLDIIPAEVRSAQDAGFTVVGNMSQTILEVAYTMRGLDRLMLDFYERPEYVDLLFTRLAEQRVYQGRALAEAGVDAVRIGDDIATQEALMISPAMYRKWLKPRHAAAIAAARSVEPDMPVSYHSDGNLTALLPDLIEIGVTAINPVQPECMDLREIKREFGRDLALWGCTPVQSIYAHGSADDIRRHVRVLANEIAPTGGVIVQFMNIVLTPRVLDNLRAFFCAFHSL